MSIATTAAEYHDRYLAAFNADAYADATDAYARARACADATAWKRLADGMVECLKHIPSPTNEGRLKDVDNG